MNDPYRTLGLQPGASDDEAKAAFRKLAKTCHPDLHPDDPMAESRFKQINEAYDTITKGGAPEPMMAGGFRSGGFSFRMDDLFTNGGPFDDLFGRPRRNMATVLECRLTLEELFSGKDLTVQMPNGRASKVTIPPGMHHGMRITLPQGGSQINPTLPPGDMHVVVHMLPHARFHRDGNSLIMVQPVTAFDVLLGNEIEVIGIDGRTFQVNIPTYDSSRRLRLAGQGMPDVYSGVRGDLLIELLVQYPSLNDEQRDLLRQVIDSGKVTA